MRQAPPNLDGNGRGSRQDHQSFEERYASLRLHGCTYDGEAERVRHCVTEVVERARQQR